MSIDGDWNEFDSGDGCVFERSLVVPGVRARVVGQDGLFHVTISQHLESHEGHGVRVLEERDFPILREAANWVDAWESKLEQDADT